MRRLHCSEIWGGIKDAELDVCSAGLTASLYSSACDGGKGGDAYYFSLCDSDCINHLVLADVVGHGEGVSQISEWVYGQLQDHVNDTDQPAMMTELNNRIVEKGFSAMTTAVIITYYRPEHRVYFSYAGHPPMLARSNGGAWTALQLADGVEARNLPLGVTAGTRYDMGEAPFQEGDKLFLFSDGVLEAPNASGELFGSHRVESALREVGDQEPLQIKAHMLTRLREWAGREFRHDDVTLIAVELA